MEERGNFYGKKVIKRDGTVIDFDARRIVNAISMAFKQHSRVIPEELVSKIAHQIENLENKIMSVEEIQDLVVKN